MLSVKKVISTLAILILLSLISFAEEESVLEIFADHKIDFETPGLMKFLEDGFPPNTNWNDLPKMPTEKTQLLIYAIQEIGKRHKKEAVPLLIKYAKLEFPKGAGKIIQRDIESSLIDERFRQQERLYSYLKFNSMVALGWIKDKNALSTVKEIFQNEKDEIIKIQYALTLGMLGDTESVSYLVKAVSSSNKAESISAAANFFYLTGVNSGISANTAAAKRRQRAKEVVDWWDKNRASFAIIPNEAARRRLDPIDDYPKLEPGSTRALLLASSYYLDFSNQHKSFEAREDLNRRGKKLTDEFEKISLDNTEDLRIRQEAIKRYVVIKENKSKSLLKKLLKDENSEIIELSEKLLKQIKEGKIKSDK